MLIIPLHRLDNIIVVVIIISNIKEVIVPFNMVIKEDIKGYMAN